MHKNRISSKGVSECKVIYERILFFLSRKLNKLQSGKEDGKVNKDKKKKKKKHRKKSRSSEEGQYQYILSIVIEIYRHRGNMGILKITSRCIIKWDATKTLIYQKFSLTWLSNDLS